MKLRSLALATVVLTSLYACAEGVSDLEDDNGSGKPIAEEDAGSDASTQRPTSSSGSSGSASPPRDSGTGSSSGEASSSSSSSGAQGGSSSSGGGNNNNVCDPETNEFVGIQVGLCFLVGSSCLSELGIRTTSSCSDCSGGECCASVAGGNYCAAPLM